MSRVIKSSAESPTGIRVVDTGERIETCNVLGDLLHTVEFSLRGEGILIARWRGDALEAEIKEIVGDHFLPTFIASGCTRALLDTRELMTVWDGVNDWQREVIMPQAYRAGLQRTAVLIPGSEADLADLHQYASERFAEEDPRIAAFTSEEAALAWLRRPVDR